MELLLAFLFPRSLAKEAVLLSPNLGSSYSGPPNFEREYI